MVSGRVAIVAMTVVVAVSGIAGEAEASCVAPLLTADAAHGAPGAEVELRGQYFGTACNDVVVDGTTAGPPLGEPRTDIRLAIVQDGQVLQLLSANPINAAADYTFAVEITLPTQLHPGPASIRVDGETGVELPFTITDVTAVHSTTTAASSTAPDSILAPAALGSSAGTTTTIAAPNDTSASMWPWLLAAVAVALAGAITALVRSRRKTDQTST